MLEGLSENRRRTESVTQVNCADNYKDKVITVSNAPKPTANTYWVLALGQALLSVESPPPVNFKR